MEFMVAHACIRKHQDLCDVMINVGSRKILAHKYVSVKYFFLP